jgi:hypothetical protein
MIDMCGDSKAWRNPGVFCSDSVDLRAAAVCGRAQRLRMTARCGCHILTLPAGTSTGTVEVLVVLDY